MKLEGTVYCEGPDCENRSHLGPDHFNDAGKIDNLPPGFVLLRTFGSRYDNTHVFCDTDCAMKWCARFDPPEIIPIGPDGPEFPDSEGKANG